MIQLIIITHRQIGHQMLQMAIDTFGTAPMPTHVLSVLPEESFDHLLQRLQSLMDQRTEAQQTLIITDLYGATPANIACRLLHDENIRVVTGMNLPMLLKIFNYPDRDLHAMAMLAVEGGRNGIMLCDESMCTLNHHSAA